jgi:hypothetical protein
MKRAGVEREQEVPDGITKYVITKNLLAASSGSQYRINEICGDFRLPGEIEVRQREPELHQLRDRGFNVSLGISSATAHSRHVQTLRIVVVSA